jgi:hypothetical protein
MHLLHIETSGNQSFIFSTNKLRENVGASELIWRIGQFAAAAAARPGCQTIIATSGKATILAPDEDTARAIVREVTSKAVREAPGVEVHAAITPFDPAGEPLRDALARVRREHESLRGTLPSPATRFMRLPCVADCSTSGLPAAMPHRDFHGPARRTGASDLRSAVSQAKWIAAEEGIKRLAEAAGDARVMRTIADLETLEDSSLDWLAVIHADGNGLGELLMHFDQIVERAAPGSGWEAHARLLREFSEALDTCTRAAFAEAVRNVGDAPGARSKGGMLRLVPLVLGGDDLTVVCDGRIAVAFAREFLERFERKTAVGRVGELSALRPGAASPGLSACAGVAIVKPHFPFHAAYELAEDLLSSAKQIKQRLPGKPSSALDFHVLYDSSDASLARIREALRLDGGATNLTARPYVVSSGFDDHPWVAPRTMVRLQSRVKAVTARGESGRRRLPNSLLHELREALFLGRDAAEARLQLAFGRVQAGDFGELLTDRRLFHAEPGSDETIAFLLDAMELDGFWLDRSRPEEPTHA